MRSTWSPKRCAGKGGGIKVVTASTTTGWAEGNLGARVRPDILLSEVKAGGD